MSKHFSKEDLDAMLDYGLEVYRHFMGEVRIGKKMISPIRNEQNPSFSIYPHRKSGIYYWKDQGCDLFGDHWDFIRRMTGIKDYLDLAEYAKTNILKILPSGYVDKERVKVIYLEAEQRKKQRPEQVKAQVIPFFRSWTVEDVEFFAKIGLTVFDAEECLYRPVHYVQIKTQRRDFFLYSKKGNPIYAICFPSGNYKIYRPYENPKRKWVSNLEKEKDFYLLEQCKGGDTVIIQSGNRDCAAFRKHVGIDSFALNSESAALPFDVFAYLKSKYKKIYCLYDNDKQGYKGAAELYFEYGIPCLNEVYQTFGVKDFCELAEHHFDRMGEFILEIYSRI